MYLTHYLLGWPAYILAGKSGGPKYGGTNHFWPYAPFNNGEKELFPGSWKQKVLKSDLGIVAFMGVLALWAKASSWQTVGLIYGLPYLVVNFWLVCYTWL
jgi:omega-6 fatty acid desaturase (delta-12 desaturase)